MKNDQAKVSVVIDTNVFVSALVFGGNPRKVMDLITDKVVRLVMSEEIMTELRRVITLEFKEHINGLARYEALLKISAAWVPLGRRIIVVSRDPDDNKVIETASASGAQYIISGDKDLLVLKEYEGIQILTPTDFLKLYNSAEN